MVVVFVAVKRDGWECGGDDDGGLDGGCDNTDVMESVMLILW